jgi:hypothetical protein
VSGSARRAQPFGLELGEAGGDLVGVEAQPRPLARAEPARAELHGVGVHPGALDPPPLRDVGGAQQPRRPPGRRVEPSRYELGDADGDRLDRLRVEPHRRALIRDRVWAF